MKLETRGSVGWRGVRGEEMSGRSESCGFIPVSSCEETMPTLAAASVAML